MACKARPETQLLCITTLGHRRQCQKLEGSRARARVGKLRPNLACCLFLYGSWARPEQAGAVSFEDQVRVSPFALLPYSVPST